ncbi:hypothetical protein BC835DRAFT_716470 [Cytidiella melzeri]|nr:hypothetical protein BC835DRAFT_716470 [Cytidiella melzeri]
MIWLCRRTSKRNRKFVVATTPRPFILKGAEPSASSRFSTKFARLSGTFDSLDSVTEYSHLATQATSPSAVQELADEFSPTSTLFSFKRVSQSWARRKSRPQSMSAVPLMPPRWQDPALQVPAPTASTTTTTPEAYNSTWPNHQMTMLPRAL